MTTEEIVNTTAQQAQITMTGETRVDEHGRHDKWDRGGVYTTAGEFDLEATEELLAERFEAVVDELPESVGPFERVDARDSRYADRQIRARYETVEEYETAVCVYPRGPYLRAWTVAIEEYGPPVMDDPPADTGYRSMANSILVSGLDDPSAAVETAVGWMQDYDPAAASNVGGDRYV
jgi:hypothetical protein